MRTLIDMAERVARSDASILILGETGVGKEWLARAIHASSGRAAGPFQAVNCAAVPESLLESELFGHEKGSFTGAHRAHRGHFEMAHRGTVFLDEIADMPVHLQSKLLRVLAERQIQRVGAERPLMIDVRVLAATNRDMERALAERTLRDDLYYRLSVVTLEVPPLRDRREDIVPLVHGYLEHFGRQLGRPDVQIRQDALDALTRYAWPGNVRELINVVERAVLLCRGRLITPTDLPVAVTRELDQHRTASDRPQATGDEVLFPHPWLDLDLPAFRRRLVDGAEPAYLAHQLRATGGRIGDTADRIGIDARSLYDRMRRYGLRKEDYKEAR
jgi:DNA-binding NtrC family response regulator